MRAPRGEHGLAVRDVRPLGQPWVGGLAAEPPHQRMPRVDLEHRLDGQPGASQPVRDVKARPCGDDLGANQQIVTEQNRARGFIVAYRLHLPPPARRHGAGPGATAGGEGR